MYVCTVTSEETVVKSMRVNAAGIAYCAAFIGISKVLKSKMSLA
jgi:hypothetical protein